MPKYVGRRIVPKHGGIWDKTKEYEELIIVRCVKKLVSAISPSCRSRLERKSLMNTTGLYAVSSVSRSGWQRII